MMQVSAAVRLMPRPPARVDSRNTNMFGSLLNAFMLACGASKVRTFSDCCVPHQRGPRCALEPCKTIVRLMRVPWQICIPAVLLTRFRKNATQTCSGTSGVAQWTSARGNRAR